jgi:hypothetical protein
MEIKMKNYNFKYPVLILDDKRKHIGCIKSRFEICSIKGVSFYNKLIVIDSDGQSLKIEGVKKTLNAPFKYWILYFQRMFEVEYEYAIGEIYSLDQTKDIAMQYVKRKPHFWLALDTIQGIKDRIYRAKTFAELFLIFK